MTFLDVIVLALTILLAFGGWGLVLEWLNLQDKRGDREMHCPPHDWQGQFEDDPTSPDGFKYVGLRCGKCKQPPGKVGQFVSWTWPYGPP